MTQLMKEGKLPPVDCDRLISRWGRISLSKSEEIFRTMIERDDKKIIFSYIRMIQVYGNYRYSKRAAEIFEELKNKNVVVNPEIYGIMILSCKRAGDWETALKYLRESQKLNLINDNNYGKCIGVCSRAHQYNLAFELLDEVHKHGLEVSTLTCNSFLKGCTRKLVNTLKIISHMRRFSIRPNTKTYIISMKCYNFHKRYDLTIDSFSKIRRENIDDEVIDLVLEACEKSHNWALGLGILSYPNFKPERLNQVINFLVQGHLYFDAEYLMLNSVNLLSKDIDLMEDSWGLIFIIIQYLIKYRICGYVLSLTDKNLDYAKTLLIECGIHFGEYNNKLYI